MNTRRKPKPPPTDISEFHAEIDALVQRYHDADYCTGCLAAALVSAAVELITKADGLCWPEQFPEEVVCIDALCTLIVTRPGRAPAPETLQ